VLVFPEHQAFLGGEPLAASVQRLRRAAPEKKLAMEVKSVAAALEACGAGFDVVQAEKFSAADISTLAAEVKNRKLPSLIAAAGGITADNAAEYARAGAHILVTSMPYYARPRDVAVTIAAAAI
jgi:molybdenum transport protein